jgi:hypothetical protein
MKRVRELVDAHSAYWWKLTDARPYALVRIGLSLCAFTNVAELWRRREEYFGPNASIGAKTVREAIGSEPYHSIFNHLTTDASVTACFLFGIVALVCLAIGFHARVAAIAVFVWHVSYVNRVFPVLHSWDDVYRCYFFLLAISPCGAVWSVDAWRKRGKNVGPPDAVPLVPSYGLRLMQWQFLVLYGVTMLSKVPDPSWRNGQLLGYFDASMYGRFPNEAFMARHDVLGSALTYASLLIEATIPFLMWRQRTRWFGLFVGWSFHLVIAITSRVEVFSFSVVPLYFAFFDGNDVDALVSAASRLRASVASKRAG